MTLTPLVPALPVEGGRRRWTLAASVALHALIVGAVLWFVVQRPPSPGGQGNPSYELVFQGPTGGTPSPDNSKVKTQPLPPSQPANLPPPPDAAEGIPAPTPLTQPDPAATGAPPPAETAPPPAPPTPTPEAAAPAPAPTAAPTPALAEAAPPPVVEAAPDQTAELARPTPEAPAVRLEMPPTETAPATQAPIMPQPPPPLPSVEPQAKPTPQPAPRPVPRPSPRPQLGTLSNPMDLSLAPSAPRPAARGSVASRAIDLSPPAERQGSTRADPYAQIRAANASADWNRGLLSYWLKHRYYPEQAIQNGDQGAVTLQVTVNRSGKVESVEVISRSGSPWLDMAAVATWRNAQLPPFTNEMREDRISFPIPIQYFLVNH